MAVAFICQSAAGLAVDAAGEAAAAAPPVTAETTARQARMASVAAPKSTTR
jgi:hypothetical protein